MEAAGSLTSNPVSYTARIVAAKRAIEQLQLNPLFQDPYAAALAGEEVDRLLNHWQTIAAKQGRSIQDVILKRTRYIVLRTRFLDDLIREAIGQGDYRQLVILGAGLDTRAFRLSWPEGMRVYEVDRRDLLDYKRRVLQEVTPGCDYRGIAGDLADPEATWAIALNQSGFRRDQPTIWILEGVLMYLSALEVHRLLQTISNLSAVGSVWGLDGVTVGSIAASERAKQADRGRVVRHWQFGCDDFPALLAPYGWRAEAKPPKEIRGGFGRYPDTLPIDAEESPLENQLPTNDRGVYLIRAHKQGRSG